MADTNAHYKFTMTGLQKAQEIVSAINLLGGKARLGETWMDYGAGIWWETILVYSKNLDMDYQALNPRDFKEMNNGTIQPDAIKEIVMYAIK